MRKKEKKYHIRLIKQRKLEGFQSILVKNHLTDNEIKFKEFFRITRYQFNYILELIQDDLITNPYNRVKDPITPTKKLAITLR